MAIHSSVLAWRIPGTGEPGGLPSMGSHRVGHDSVQIQGTPTYQHLVKHSLTPACIGVTSKAPLVLIQWVWPENMHFYQVSR